MKIAWTGVLLALVAAPGCWMPNFLQPEAPPPPPAVVEQPKPRTLVTPERVTPANAHQAADALRDELERVGKENPF